MDERVTPLLESGLVPPLPHTSGATFITDGGMETTLLYQRGIELPEFASFPLLETEEGRAALRAYFQPYLDIARDRGVSILLDTPTWRANPDWGEKLGYSLERLEEANRARCASWTSSAATPTSSSAAAWARAGTATFRVS
jgi:S-methylmethionine-dependent homocysteine/selenocysteine methylase